MQNESDLSGLHQYSLWPLAIALLLIVAIVIVFLSILWTTRKKPIKSVATLPKALKQEVDIAALQQKYLQLVDALEGSYLNKEITARVAHQQLSLLLRLFVREVTGYRVDVMTLADIKRNDKLTRLAGPIELYYEPEFAAALMGNVSHAISKGKEMIITWS